MARTVTCFPMHRQRGEVIRCAGNLDRIHGELASRYWREEMRLLAHRMKSIGMTEAEVSKQVLLFTGAVWRKCSAPMPSAHYSKLTANDGEVLHVAVHVAWIRRYLLETPRNQGEQHATSSNMKPEKSSLFA